MKEERVDDRTRTGDILIHSQGVDRVSPRENQSEISADGRFVRRFVEPDLPAELAGVAQVWRGLPEHIRLAILALAKHQ